MEHDPGIASPGVTTRTALLSIGGFWTFYFLISSARWAVLGMDDQLAGLVSRLIVSTVSMAVTVPVWLALRRLGRSSFARRVMVAALCALPAAILYSATNYYAFLPVAQAHSTRMVVAGNDRDKVMMVQVGGGGDDRMTPLLGIADNAVNGYFFFAAWAALFLALSFAAETGAAERRAARFGAAAQAAELRALRYQVNPHFLFNTLNSLSSLIMTDRRDAAEAMVMNLSTFFRTSLTGDPTEDVPLADELRLQRLYLEIEAVRFPERMLVDVAVPEALMGACIPGLILQPLVENAIKYGVSRARRPVRIAIRGREEDGRLVLEVADDGDEAATSAAGAGSGIGLRNVRERLAARFGAAAAVTWGRAADGGWTVRLTMPLVRDGCR